MNSAINLRLPTGTGLRGTVVCYSSFEPYELADYLAALAEVEPDIAVKVFRMPTAHLAAALMSPGSLPPADMVFGWAATAASPEIIAQFLGNRYESPTGFSTAFCFDRSRLKNLGTVPPNTWLDLVSPILRPHVVMPDPRVSGAGFLAVTTVLQRYGQLEGWDILRAAFAGLQLVRSAWEPAAAMGMGEKAVGITVRIAAVQRATQCNDVDWCEPADAIGCEPEVYAVLASSTNMAAASRIMEWIMSAAAIPYYRRHAKFVFASEDSPGNRLLIDVGSAVASRSTILAKWQETFG